MHLDSLDLDAARAGEDAPEHLDACDECRGEVHALRVLAAEMARATRIAVPPQVDRAVLARRRPRRIGWLAAAAALLVALALWAASTRRPDIVDAYRLALDGRDAVPVARGSVLVFALLGAVDVREGRFAAHDIWIDAGERPLAAYQVEVAGKAVVVGIEGGDGVFAVAPYYDPAALKAGRIVLAAFTTDTKPPAGRVRVARLHVQEGPDAAYRVRVVAAATVGGDRIEAKAKLGAEK